MNVYRHLARAAVLFIALVAVAPPVLAEPVGILTQNATDELAESLGLAVCRVYVQFDDPADNLINVQSAHISTDDPMGFYQHEFGTDTAPQSVFCALFPELCLDSFVTIGLTDGSGGTGIGSSFNSCAFNCLRSPPCIPGAEAESGECGQLLGDWYNSNPTGGQGHPDENLLVLIAQLTVQQGYNNSGTLNLLFNDGSVELPASFTCFCSSDGDCDDANPCTDDACTADSICTHSPSTAACDDGLFCNGTDTCAGGTCIHSGSPCVGGLPCNNICNEGEDDCFTPSGWFCGSSANTACDNPDSCDGSGVCQPNPEPDGTACTSDGNDCTEDVCAGGECSHPNIVDGTACGSSADTDCDYPDTCDSNGACQANYATAGTPCGSGADTDCDNPAACNDSGTCEPNYEADGTPCNDGLQCKVNDQCNNGVCVGENICDDGDLATIDLCAADGCYHVQIPKQPTPGSIVGWGSQVIVPPDQLTDLVAIETGWSSHSLGLRSDGSIVGWGSIGYYDGLNVPAPNVDFVAMAMGSKHNLGLKSDGSIVGWGDNGSGQLNVPAPNTDFVAIAAGYNHSLGLKSDGSIVGWGYNGDGQLNVPAPNTDFVAIAASDNEFFGYTLGLKSDGSIVGWGANGSGQLNVVPEPNMDFVAIAVGFNHSLGLKSDGSIVAWGSNSSGQLNVPVPNTGFMGIAASNYHSLGLKSDGSIVGWGLNDYGQLNVPVPNADFVAISAGYSRSLGLKSNGTMAAWGNNEQGQLNGPYPNIDFVSVEVGDYHALGLKSDGSILGWGNNGSNVPTPNAGFVAVVAGSGHSLGLKSDGSIVGWGLNDYGQLNVPGPNTDFVAISAGNYHSLGLKSGGSIVGWGANFYGQLNVPAPNSDFVAIATSGRSASCFDQWIGCYANSTFSLGLKSDGSIVGWGDNGSGQLIVPAPNTDFVAIAAGGGGVAVYDSNLGGCLSCTAWGNGLGLKADGSIVGWGDNSSGQLDVPEPNTDFVAIAAGESHSLGLKSDGSIVSWGDNSFGQSNVPEPNTGFVAIAAGIDQSLAIVAPPQPPVLQLKLDIKPNKCPNKIKLGSNAAVWVVIAGQADFDIQSIDLDSLQLRRADGVGVSLSPDGNPRLIDWATPFEGQPCDCDSAFTDGIDDVRTKFHVDELNSALQLTGPAGTTYELEMLGQLTDGTPFAARDCILIDRNNGT